MTWGDFCYKLIKDGKNSKSNFSGGIELGIDKGFPKALIKVAFGKEVTDLDSQQLRKKLKSVTEDVICELMMEHDIALFIDDFEKASTPIVKRVSDMCKLLTESYISENAKIITVGTGDIYHRLIEFDPSLEGRMYQLSLGTFNHKDDSWHFLAEGFNKLGIDHPSTLYDKGYITIEEVDACKAAIYEAANGLPKNLNLLGREIGLCAREDRRRVTVHDVISTSTKMPKTNYRKYASEFPALLKLVKSKKVIRDVLSILYKNGSGSIHHVVETAHELEHVYPENQIRHAINELAKADFITRTGSNRDVFFVSNPTLAHTLAVISTYPQKYNAPKVFFENEYQFELTFAS